MANSATPRRRRRPLALTLSLALAGLAWTVPAGAQSADAAAREYFEQGYAAAQAGSFDEACERFRLAYAASPNFSVLFNLGQAYGAAGRPVEAASTLARYLSLGGVAIDSEQRSTTEQLIAYYRRRIGGVRVSSLPAGAVITLDGAPVGSAPLSGPFDAATGRHALSVRASGYQPFVADIDVRVGEVTSVVPRLRAEDAPSSPAAAGCGTACGRLRELERARGSHARTQKLVALSLGGAAVLTGGAALTLALISGSRYRDWQRKSEAFTAAFQRDPSSTNAEQLERLLREETSVRNLDAAALGLGVGAGFLAISSLALFFTAGGSSNIPRVGVGLRGDFGIQLQSSF